MLYEIILNQLVSANNMRKSKKKPLDHTAMASTRIKQLFAQAEEAWSNDPQMSHRYINLARKISMKYKVRIPPEYKRFAVPRDIDLKKPSPQHKPNLIVQSDYQKLAAGIFSNDPFLLYSHNPRPTEHTMMTTPGGRLPDTHLLGGRVLTKPQGWIG